MAFHFTDNVHTKSFTPKEYQVELLEAAKERNIIVCLATAPGKVFIATKLIQELSDIIRRPWQDSGKRTVYLVDSSFLVSQQASYLRHLTDLRIGEYSSLEHLHWDYDQWDKELVNNQVLVMTSEICLQLLEQQFLSLSLVNLLVLDDCHRALRDLPMRQIMKVYCKNCSDPPKILGLAAPLLNGHCDPYRLEKEICCLEKTLHCKAETASDIVSVLRYCTKPKEFIVECPVYNPGELDCELEKIISDALEFLNDHRYDPSEMYDDEFTEELKGIPDPKIDPCRILNDFLSVLRTLGPFSADKAAFSLLIQLEKMKVKIPYERHFLLLCMVSSVLVKIRAICDLAFQSLSDKEKIYKYSSPKLFRLLEILRQFKYDKPDAVKLSPNVNSPETGKISDSENHTKTVDEPNNQESTAHLKCNGHCDIDSKSASRKRHRVRHHHHRDNKNFVLNESLSSTEICNGFDENICVDEDFQDKYNDNINNNNNMTIEELTDSSEHMTIENNVDGTELCNGLQKMTLELTNPTSDTTSPDDSVNRVTRQGRGGKRLTRRQLRENIEAARRGKGDVSNTPRSCCNVADDVECLCGIVFVSHRFTANVLYHVLIDLRRCDEDFGFLSVQYTVDKIADPINDPREAEIEHHKQEEVLKRFRKRDCNLLVATSVLEEGIDIPKCNLVIRFDLPLSYRSYVNCKGRAKAQEAHYFLMVEEKFLNTLIDHLAEYTEIEQLLLRKCENKESSEEEERDADLYTNCIEPYSPANSALNASVNLASAVALVNRYCAKLPSDTFTRLTPIWSMHTVDSSDGKVLFACTLRLPINSPVKQDIIGPPMPTRALARRMVALQACKVLHNAKELDDNLQPIGKESFCQQGENDGVLIIQDEAEEGYSKDSTEPRPGTTKRRQYYYKRIADALTNCRPLPGKPAFLYHISLELTCPLPEEQNTRGRKIYPPEDFPQGFGILTLKQIPKICPFPIFTRSGEVQVSLKLSCMDVMFDDLRLEWIVTFLNYTFTSVLRLQKYLMMFDPEASENSYFIVPTRMKDGVAIVDWEFLQNIYENRDLHPRPISEEERASFKFDASKYHDAVVMPWYRNQDQPQYFYVAEICSHLNPKSTFPGCEYKTFDEYYFKKYGIRIQDSKQPLLDVDHTSARLNFLTPRYVNRKGVALPTSSEETKRAKRENLEQKQILVPELCTVHPFPASLWRKAVCLPCILYRINALLLADQIRCHVAESISLGCVKLKPDFEWPPLDFGWSLADVLRKSKESTMKAIEPSSPTEDAGDEDSSEDDVKLKDEYVIDGDSKNQNGDWMEIGTWSNEMADNATPSDEIDFIDTDLTLGNRLTIISDGRVRYGSPTSSLGYVHYDNDYDGCDTDDSSDVGVDIDHSEISEERTSGIRIEFKGDEAEAVEYDRFDEKKENYPGSETSGFGEDPIWDFSDCKTDSGEEDLENKEDYQLIIERNRKHILASNTIIRSEEPVVIVKRSKEEEFAKQDSVTNIFTLPEMSQTVTANDCVEKECSAKSDGDSHIQKQDLQKEVFSGKKFSFDAQPELEGHPGPSPSVILQALTMSNANDGINLERLETIGDSFLKYAITAYLYCTYENIHEGKLSHLRSKQVSNLNLYRLGRRKVFGESMIATKFEPHDNWLPPCYYVPRELEQALIEAGVPACHWNRADLPSLRGMSRDEICQLVKERSEELTPENEQSSSSKLEALPCFIPYNLITQHSIPDKSVADCVEALIGAYLISCGPRGALLFMAWLGICVLPREEVILPDGTKEIHYGCLKSPPSPLLHNIPNPHTELSRLLDGYEAFEAHIGYWFRDRSYLLQALTHASYSPNRLTDCYQRLEFLGDAILDYLITRHLYEDPRQHSPGALTDLRSALVNNTIFASLAVRHGFHKYFRHLSPGLNEVVDRFVRIQEENGHTISEEYYLIEEEECEEAEDVEVPKALGDVFESVAGAIFMDSGMSLDAVWDVYYRMMKTEIEQFSTNVPKSPIRELLELEPETAKFGKPEKLADGRRVRVTVEVFSKGTYKGIGRNYRIAKCTAAKCALKQLKKHKLLSPKTC